MFIWVVYYIVAIHFTTVIFNKNSGRNLFLPGWFKPRFKPLTAETCHPCNTWVPSRSTGRPTTSEPQQKHSWTDCASTPAQLTAFSSLHTHLWYVLSLSRCQVLPRHFYNKPLSKNISTAPISSHDVNSETEMFSAPIWTICSWCRHYNHYVINNN